MPQVFYDNEIIRCVDSSIGGNRHFKGLTVGQNYTVKRSWLKNRGPTLHQHGKSRNPRWLVELKEIPNGIFSCRRFERINFLPEDLFNV